jgi:hypothetical protein
MPIEQCKIDHFCDCLVDMFGGYTSDGLCNGKYKMKDGSIVTDTCRKIIVCIEDKEIFALRGLCIEMATDMRQESIYLERTSSVVEFVAPNMA